MEKKQNSFGNYVSGNVKPLVMHEFITENDGLIFTYEDVKRAESEGYSKGFTESKLFIYPILSTDYYG